MEGTHGRILGVGDRPSPRTAAGSDVWALVSEGQTVLGG